MKVKHQISMLVCLLFLGIISGHAQETLTYQDGKKPTAAEAKLDKALMECLQGQETFKDFSFSTWTAKVHFYARKMLQRMSSEHVEAIASQKSIVKALNEIANTCPQFSTSKASKELVAIKDIYEKGIEYGTGSASTGLFEADEIEAKVTNTKYMEKLVKTLESLRKKLGITQYIIRIQED